MIHKQKCHQQESPKSRTLSHFYMAATLIPSPPNFGDHDQYVKFFPTLHCWTTQAAGEGGGEVGKYSGLKVCRCSKAWTIRRKLRGNTGQQPIRWNRNMDVEDLKGGRKIPEIWGNISVCFKVFVCICKIEIYVMSDLAKICSAWSCWTHLIKTKAYCKCFTISFVEGVNIYIYIYIYI